MAAADGDARVVLVTARLLEDDAAAPAFVAYDPDDAGRPVGDDREASGFELYRGDESDAELEDAGNARLVDLSWAVERWPGLQVLVDEHDPGTVGAWLADGEDWLELDEEPGAEGELDPPSR